MADETPRDTNSESTAADGTALGKASEPGSTSGTTPEPIPGPTPASTAGPSLETPAEPDPEPKPLDVPLEQQLGALPPLEYPGGSRDQDFDQWAADKRRGRIRTEIVGGVLIILAGAVASVVTGRSAFFVLAIFGVGALAAYEFLVTSFE